MTKRCNKCDRPLVVNGIHMGIPFTTWKQTSGVGTYIPKLFCGKCYDEITVDEQKVEKDTFVDPWYLSH